MHLSIYKAFLVGRTFHNRPQCGRRREYKNFRLRQARKDCPLKYDGNSALQKEEPIDDGAIESNVLDGEFPSIAQTNI